MGRDEEKDGVDGNSRVPAAADAADGAATLVSVGAAAAAVGSVAPSTPPGSETENNCHGFE